VTPCGDFGSAAPPFSPAGIAREKPVCSSSAGSRGRFRQNQRLRAGTGAKDLDWMRFETSRVARLFEGEVRRLGRHPHQTDEELA